MNGWLAHEDMLVGTKLGELFGKKRRGQQKIIVTLDA